MSGAMQTPLVDLLRNVPADARVSYKHSPTDYQMIPVGRLANEAADEIERLRDQLHLAEVVRAAQVEGLTQGAAGWRERANQLGAEVAGLREDAERYRWLRPRLFSADFDYNENGVVALVFEMPPNSQIWADCDMTVDAARKGTT